MGNRHPVLPFSFIAVVLLLVAIADLPYGYYTFLRFVVCAVSAYAAYKAYDTGKHLWIFVCAAVAVLFNPIVPIHLDRETWAVLDIGTAILLALAGMFIRTPKTTSPSVDSATRAEVLPQDAAVYRSGDQVWETEGSGDDLCVRVHYYMYRCTDCEKGFAYEEGSEHGKGDDSLTCPWCGGKALLESQRVSTRPIEQHRLLWPESGRPHS